MVTYEILTDKRYDLSVLLEQAFVMFSFVLIDTVWTYTGHGRLNAWWTGVRVMSVKAIVLLLDEGYVRITVSRKQKSAGSGSPNTHEDASAFSTGGSVVSCSSCQQLPDCRPPVERAFCICGNSYNPIANNTPAPVGAGQGRDIVSSEDTMQNDSTSDPLRRKSRDYLNRVKVYHEGRYAQVWETFTEAIDDPAICEVTTKRFSLVRGIAHAVKTLGGVVYAPQVQYLRFVDGEYDERHAVFLVRFKLPE